jgi:pimeloyl-ACP methyl ester carboxylesterase
VRKVGSVPIAVEDHGGTGPDVLLLHGGGRTRRDWDAFAPLLRDHGYRPVAFDLRWHGESGPAPWSWPGAEADVAAVIEECGLRAPAVIGHSLGGMVAALWATHHPECPLAVNVDGHGNPTRPDQFVDPGGDPGAYQSLLAVLGNAVEGVREPYAQIMGEVNGLDLYAAYRATRCPLLVVSGVAPGGVEFLPEVLRAPWEAYRRWVWSELDAVAARVPLMSVASLPTGHDVHLEDPEGLLRLVLERLVPERTAPGP